MTDSGVDSSNGIRDNPLFDPQVLFNLPAIPINEAGQAMPVNFHERPHASIGKITRKKHKSLSALRIQTKMMTMIEKKESSYCRLLHESISLERKTLHFSAFTNNTELCERLLQSGADPNASDAFKRSPLHIAASRGYTDVVKILLKYGANPNIKNHLEKTPLHLAACKNNVPVVIELLDAGTDVSSIDKTGHNPIQLAQSKLKSIQMRPSGAGNFEETRQLIGEICLVLEMMLKYMKIQNANAAQLESVRSRLEGVSTHEQVDSEVVNLLKSLDSLKLR